MFILGRRRPEIVGPDYYPFKAGSYGPYSPEVTLDCEALVAQGLTEVSRSGPGLRMHVHYRGTREGLVTVKALPVEESAARYLVQLRTWATELTFTDLVASICQEWPEQRENAIFGALVTPSAS